MGVYRFAVDLVHGSMFGPSVNIWHCRTDGDIETAQADGIMTALEAFYDGWAAQRATGSIVRWAGEMTSVGANPVVLTPGTAWESPATGNQSPLPGSIAICVNWVTPTGGRSGKGRTFCAPVNLETCGGDGKPTSTALTAVRDAATDLVDASSAANEWALGVYSRQDALLRDFSGASVMSRFAVMTSRRD